jgi:ribA/ribD-fused uncharacterized protein
MNTINGFKEEPYKFLSNMTKSKDMRIIYDDIVFSSTESAYQYAKAFTDEDKAKMLGEKDNPFMAKRKSRMIKVREDWASVNLGIMRDLLDQKFHQQPYAQLLIDTGDDYIIESNYWHDCFYGSCTCEKCKDKEKLNHLGKMLMELRVELIEESM